jgi:hypothetical protein
MLIVQHDRHGLSVATEVDTDGDLHIFTSSSGLFLTPAEQDTLIQHLIEVRGAGRVQELLNQPWDGTERRAEVSGNWYDLRA